MNNNQKNDDNSSLSDMIDNYENDNALRNKIEAIKKQKAAQEEALRQQEIQSRMDEIQKSKQPAQNELPKTIAPEAKALNETTEIPSMAESTPFMSADATQVFNADTITPQDDGDKTLVIMDNMKQRNFNTKISVEDEVHSTSNIADDERLAPEFEMNEEEITEEDIKEYLPEQNKKKKKPMDTNKKNKMITYGIAGVAGICVIGLIIFGLNFFGILGGDKDQDLKLDEVTLDDKVNMEEIGANNFTIKSSEIEKVTDATLIKLSKAEARSTEDKTKVQVTTVDKTELKAEKGTYKVSFSTKKGTKVTVKATVSDAEKKEEEGDKEPTKDNSAKINELQGQIKINNDQIAALQAENTSYQNTIDSGPEEIAKIDNGYAERLSSANREYSTAESAMNSAKADWEAAKGTSGEQAAKSKYDKAKANYDAANNELARLNTEISQKKQEINGRVSTASTQLENNNQKIIELQNAVIDLQNQLNAL